MRKLIQNGKVCLQGKIVKTDLLIIDNKIAKIGNIPTTAEIDETIDANGSYIIPGLIDFHVHLDDEIGNYYIADTYRSGSQVAIQNGITTIVSFITQPEHMLLEDAIDIAFHKAQNECFCDYTWHLTPTNWDDETINHLIPYFEKGFNTIKLYTTYKNAGIYSDYADIEHILKKLKPYNIRTLIHCEDEKILSEELKNRYPLEDADSYSEMRPKEAEVEAIEKIIHIANKLSVPVHIVHVSTTEGAELIEMERQYGLITCETAPQYLFLNKEKLEPEDGYRYLSTPPLRDKKNQLQLMQLAQENYFDIYATDHCPFSKQDKDEYQDNILDVPKGLPGLGALLHMIAKLYENKEEAIINIAAKLSETPAKLAGIYPYKGNIAVGADADLVILNFTGKENKIIPTLSDAYNPYEEFNSNIDIKNVFLRGEQIVKDNEVINTENPKGTCLCEMD